MKLPYFLTAEGRQTVRVAQEQLSIVGEKNNKRVRHARAITRRDLLEKCFTAAVGALGGSILAYGLANSEKDSPSQPEMAMPELLAKGVIRIGVRSSPEEKERVRGAIRKALSIVLTDPALAAVYGKSDVVEHIVVPDVREALVGALLLADPTGRRANEVSEPEDGAAYTLAIETQEKDRSLVHVHNFMFLRAELLDPDAEPQLLMTLDHECRHMLRRGRGLSRSAEEREVYTEGISRMQRLARKLQERGGNDAELGRRLLSEAIPAHMERLSTWKASRR